MDANQALAAEYGVQGIPAVKGFRDGRVVAEFVGAQSRGVVSTFLDGLLAPPRLDGASRSCARAESFPTSSPRSRPDDPEGALELILDAIRTRRADERERLRELAVAIFDDLGPDDPRTVAYRRRLATALY